MEYITKHIATLLIGIFLIVCASGCSSDNTPIDSEKLDLDSISTIGASGIYVVPEVSEHQKIINVLEIDQNLKLEQDDLGNNQILSEDILIQYRDSLELNNEGRVAVLKDKTVPEQYQIVIQYNKCKEIFDFKIPEFKLYLPDFDQVSPNCHVDIVLGQYNGEKNRWIWDEIPRVDYQYVDGKFIIKIPREIWKEIKRDYILQLWITSDMKAEPESTHYMSCLCSSKFKLFKEKTTYFLWRDSNIVD